MREIGTDRNRHRQRERDREKDKERKRCKMTQATDRQTKIDRVTNTHN